MRYLVLSLMLALAACMRGAPSYPSPEAVAAAIARDGHFGPIEEWRDADIFRAHPNVRGLVRSANCRPRQDDSVVCMVEIVGASQVHELVLFSDNVWQLATEFDDANLPKVAATATTPVELSRKMNQHRELAVRRADEMNNGEQQALREIRGFYRRLGAQERVWANPVVVEWLSSEDAQLRSEALHLVDHFGINAAADALSVLERRLSEDASDAALTELAGVRVIQSRLSGRPQVRCILASTYSSEQPVSSATFEHIRSALLRSFSDNPWGLVRGANWYTPGEGKIAIEMLGDCTASLPLVQSRFRRILPVSQAQDVAQQIAELNNRWREISLKQLRSGEF